MNLKNIAILLVVTFASICIYKLSSTVPQSTTKNLTETDTLMKNISQHGGEASISEKGNSVTLIETPERCIPLINRISSVDTFFLGSHKMTITEQQFSGLRVFSETSRFNILYGTLSKKAFAGLAEKFPNINELILWGNMDSDLTELPELKHLKTFQSDMEHLITEDEARRIFLSKSLVSIDIDSAASYEVIELLRRLPNLKHMSVTVYHSNGDPRSYTLEQ